MSKLRLLLWSDCHRACAGCCNQQFDLDALPVVDDFSPFSEVLLTGGEPMLNPMLLGLITSHIRAQIPRIRQRIYLYTALPCPALSRMLPMFDGVTITMHDRRDVPALAELIEANPWIPDLFSGRIRLFEGVELPPETENLIATAKAVGCIGWNVRRGVQWDSNCPLPEGEVFMRLPPLPPLEKPRVGT
jgi:hypothetical protein